MTKPIIKYKIKNKNQELHIFQDESPESPDDWHDDECFLVYKHRDFTIDRDGFDCREIFDFLNYPPKPVVGNAYTEDEIEERIQEWEDNKGTDYSEYHIFGVKTNFPDRRWDVSTTGFVLIKKDLLKGSSINEEELTEEEARNNYAEGLIKSWNTYLSGEVYGFKVFEQLEQYKINKKDLETITEHRQIDANEFDNIAVKEIELKEIDSCWGFYGSEYEGVFDHLNLKKEELEEIE